jgi:hypothetical protein
LAELAGANLMNARIEFSTFLGATGQPSSDAGAFYNQVTCPDGTMASFDLAQTSCWAPPDDDHDGVLNADDLCPGTVADAFPALLINRYALLSDWQFHSGAKNAPVYTVAQTKGCSGMQIIALEGLGKGQAKYGLSRSALEAFIAAHA